MDKVEHQPANQDIDEVVRLWGLVKGKNTQHQRDHHVSHGAGVRLKLPRVADVLFFLLAAGFCYGVYSLFDPSGGLPLGDIGVIRPLIGLALLLGSMVFVRLSIARQ